MWLRHLKSWLVVGLLVSNLAVGLTSLVYLNSINDRYATLIDTNMPLINRLRTLTRELGTIQRYARRVIEPAAEPRWESLVDAMDEASNSARVHAAQLGRMDLFRDTPHAAALARFAQEYDERADQFLALVRAKRTEEAGRFNTDVLRPTYDRYQVALDAAADYVQQRGMDLRDRYAQESRLFSRLLLAIAGWPVVAAMLVVIPMIFLLTILIMSIFAPGIGLGRPAEPPVG